MAVLLSADCPRPSWSSNGLFEDPHHLEDSLLGIILGRGANMRHGYALTPCATRRSE
jgi:hypothetical protein